LEAGFVKTGNPELYPEFKSQFSTPQVEAVKVYTVGGFNFWSENDGEVNLIANMGYKIHEAAGGMKHRSLSKDAALPKGIALPMN